MYNLDFYYKYTGRYIIFLKYSENKYNNNFHMLELTKIIVYFHLQNIIDLNHLSICSCIYFFQYYFGIIPFLSNYNHNFHLNIHYYSFFIQYIFYSKFLYYSLYFFINDIYYPIKKMYIDFIEDDQYFEYRINDMNFFVEKKNLLGFYYLKHNIIFKFCFKNLINFDSKNLLYLFKLKS